MPQGSRASTAATFTKRGCATAPACSCPVGTFNEGRNVTVWAGVPPKEFPTLTVTREQAGGDQASSGEKVLVRWSRGARTLALWRRATLGRANRVGFRDDTRMTTFVLDTAHGPAHAHIHDMDAPQGVLVLGHGAGGGIAAKDLVSTTEVAISAGIAVALVEQPYRVAGRRSPPPAAQLDTSWTAVVEALRVQWFHELPLVVGGRSSGARVACRTSAATGAVGVLCLAFPLQPPRGARPEPRPSRLSELESVGVEVLVVQGERDPFGIPPPGAGRTVCVVPGDHSLRQGLATAAPLVGEWLLRTVRG
jgi:predicted alpha/beta-hydrolase family hydrolase